MNNTCGVAKKKKKSSPVNCSTELHGVPLKAHERIREEGTCIEWQQGYRVVRHIEFSGAVEGILVPYTLDEAEYRKRLDTRDRPRQAAKERARRLRETRKGCKNRPVDP
jgi:hypothetical protein